ncbi:Cytochrome b5 [Rhizopus azygosporus]|uniref:Cytochrome b5 n=1 Tax=Rhizopus azygosporus TaxID=86630 RepID=A0A367JP81_RHIAZ|nr:Cytochrome b5 [Rhizopus azygosporus]CEI87779.1 Putative Cytochrome-b5 reductase [Rhizopus microsporus]
MSVKLYSYEEVAKHNNRNDLWMIIDGKVYDITKFQDEHPGGEEVLIDEGAKDATGPFEDVGHSEDARDILKKYYIGDVDPTSKPIKVAKQAEQFATSGAQGNPLRILIPLALLAAWVYFKFIR